MYNIDVIFIPSSTSKTSNPCMKGIRLWLEQRDALMKDMERDVLRRTILELVKKGHVHYTDLEKKVTATCYPFATTNTFKSQLHYLLSNGYITRIARGIYETTPKDKNYLALLTS